MPEIIFESNTGVIFEKTVYKNGKCKMVVRSKEPPDHIMTYRYKDISVYQSRYISWENLNCCGGWKCDETYLQTAVQQDKKLFASISFSMYDTDFVKQVPQHNLTTEKDAGYIIEKLNTELPPDCILGIDSPDVPRHLCTIRHIFICKNGAVKDYINIPEVFLSYERLGIIIDDESKKIITSLCDVPIQLFSENAEPPFSYGNPRTGAELVFVGLLLGYPIESTAWLLERDGYFPTTKLSV